MWHTQGSVLFSPYSFFFTLMTCPVIVCASDTDNLLIDKNIESLQGKISDLLHRLCIWFSCNELHLLFLTIIYLNSKFNALKQELSLLCSV